MDILEEAYSELKRLDLVKNHCDFSTTWLNKSRRYMSLIRSSDKEASVDAIGRLAANLKYRHEYYRTSRFGNLREKSEWLTPLMRKVWTAFYEKALDRQFDNHSNP